MLYNVPSRTGVCFAADTLYELSKHPNINGLKAASGNFSLLAEVMAKCGDELNVWSGNDDQIVPLMALGGKGVISVLSNVAPQETHDLTQLCFENRYPEAAKMQFKYHNLIDALFCEVNPIPVSYTHLGKEMVRNIETIRFSNPIFTNLWDARFIESVQILSLIHIFIQADFLNDITAACRRIW